MKKLVIVLMIIGCLMSGCSKTETEAVTKEIFVIPHSFFRFAGSDVSETTESMKELGDEFYTDAKVVAEGMEITLTETQKENLIQRNNNYVKKLAEAFLKENESYRCVLDDNYQMLQLFFDEKISLPLEIETMMGIVLSYAFNYILTNDTSDWHVQFEIYNCHTNKLVVSANLPEEEFSFGTKEWEESYRQDDTKTQ